MAIVRLYTGSDGKSHFEVLNLPRGETEKLALKSGADVVLRRSSPGHFVDWHNAPRRQYVITLSGQVEIVVGDGTKRVQGPGDVTLAEDLTGEGHTTRVIGNQQRVTLVIPLA